MTYLYVREGSGRQRALLTIDGMDVEVVKDGEDLYTSIPVTQSQLDRIAVFLKECELT